MKNTNQKIIKKWIKKGVKILNPESVYIDNTVKIGRNVTIMNGVSLKNNVVIHDNVTIQENSILTNKIEVYDNVFIGPFNLIRDNTIIHNDVLIGSHCEITRSTISSNCKIGHKNFLGDANLSENVSFGAGAIIANTDFNQNYLTTIQANAKIGVNVTLVAPIVVGENCFIAAGSTITKDVPANNIAFGRAFQINKMKKTT